MEDKLNETEIAVCKAMGISHEDYLHTREAEAPKVAASSLSETETAVCKAMDISEEEYLRTGEAETSKAFD